MNWITAIKHLKIPKCYQNATLLEKNMLPEEIIILGKKWLTAKERPSLFLHGNAGSGKTYFVHALFRHLIDAGDFQKVILIRSDHLDEYLLQASKEQLFNDNGFQITLQNLMKRYSEIPILLLDDIGAERESERIRMQYFSIIDSRVSNELPTVYTSNLNLDEIRKVLGERIGSRLKIAYHISFPEKDNRKIVRLPSL